MTFNLYYSRISLPRCHVSGQTPVSIGSVDEKKFVCKAPKLTHLNYCPLNDSAGTPCRIKLKEGGPGKILCVATGKPLPKVQIKLKSGAPLTRQAAGKYRGGQKHVFSVFSRWSATHCPGAGNDSPGFVIRLVFPSVTAGILPET